MKRALALLLLLTACAPEISDFRKPNGTVSTQQQDFAECRIRAREVSSGYGGGLALLAAYNETLNDCMTAKGYAK